MTCKRQPALGCVYKLVEINGKPKIKLSQEVEKVTMPGKKIAYRLYSDDGLALIDLMQRPDEKAPEGLSDYENCSGCSRSWAGEVGRPSPYDVKEVFKDAKDDPDP